MRRRSKLARTIVVCTAGLSRRLGLGNGSTVGGRVGLALDRRLLESLGAGRSVTLVSGTNGKTTTSRLLFEALGGAEKVATSLEGANLPPGMVSALSASERETVVLETDERYLAEALRALPVRLVVLLNLARDQLDRLNEVRMVASTWRTVLGAGAVTVVANADDPLVVYASSSTKDVHYVGAGGLWKKDAPLCPQCGEPITFSVRPHWSCTCGFARPAVDAELVGGELVEKSGARHRLDLALPGRFNEANAAMAVVAAGLLGEDPEDAIAKMRAVDEVAGRFVEIEVGGAAVRLLLAKNPAGFTELLTHLGGGSDPVVVAINAHDADGHDPSWLYDVPFELLAGRTVVASGERRHDLSVRLRHAGLERVIEQDCLAYLSRQSGGRVELIANYTAFQEIRRSLSRAGSGSGGRVRKTKSQGGEPRRAEEVVDPTRKQEATGSDERGPEPAATGPAEAGPKQRPVPPRTRDSVLSVVLVHPELLGTYGDAGNAKVLADRALWRGLRVELVEAPAREPLPRSGDLYLLGGGEDAAQVASAGALSRGELRRAVERGAVVFGVCAGFQILGTSFPDGSGSPRDGIGLLEVATTKTTGARFVGEVLVETGADCPVGSLLLSGFENHAGTTVRAPGVAALGSLLAGNGNGDGHDGAYAGRVLGTYLHGPVLARNAKLCDALLGLVLGEVLAPLLDEEEQALHAQRVAAARRALAGRRQSAISGKGR